ncbi:hypothetical protein BSL78_22607 [Apostichopus japonicus]|uniref:Uncharacterized protein n=1 Tax=Stichopus japonicus TaxID=307972 RepID=A0A2G8JXS9_STIJA|nr:hypothetical protein BSL78_22607 [Apostichopus japonicus]
MQARRAVSYKRYLEDDSIPVPDRSKRRYQNVNGAGETIEHINGTSTVVPPLAQEGCNPCRGVRNNTDSVGILSEDSLLEGDQLCDRQPQGPEENNHEFNPVDSADTNGDEVENTHRTGEAANSGSLNPDPPDGLNDDNVGHNPQNGDNKDGNCDFEKFEKPLYEGSKITVCQGLLLLTQPACPVGAQLVSLG